MALITTIAQVRGHIRISNLDLDESMPDMNFAQRKNLGRFINPEFLAYLEALPLSAPQFLKNIKQNAQRALAHFAYLDELPVMHMKITDAGVRRMSTDGMPTAFRWEYEKVEATLRERAYEAMEETLREMDENVTDPLMVDWVNYDHYTRRSNKLIKDAQTFGQYVTLNRPFTTFHLLAGCLADTEMLFLSRMMPRAFYDLLKTTPPTDDDTRELLYLLQAGMANITIAFAIKKLPVEISERGVTVFQGQKDADAADRKHAPDNTLDVVLNNYMLDGDSYLTSARNLLNRKASATLWPLYFTSPNYRSPTPQPRRNESRKIFRF